MFHINIPFIFPLLILYIIIFYVISVLFYSSNFYIKVESINFSQIDAIYIMCYNIIYDHSSVKFIYYIESAILLNTFYTIAF